MRASACSPSLDARESRAFTLSFAFCKLFRQARAKHASKVWKIKEEKKRQEHPTPEALRQLFEKIDTPASPLKSSKDRSKIVEKPSQNRRKIDENSLLGGFGRPRLFRGRVGTRSGRARDAPKPAQERSWAAPGAPKAVGRRPKASPGRSQDAPWLVRSDVGVRATRQAQLDASSERFFIDFVLSRESSDVQKM